MSAPYESDTLFQSNFCRWPKLISSLSFISLQILKLAASMALHESQAIEQNPLSGAHVSYSFFCAIAIYTKRFMHFRFIFSRDIEQNDSPGIIEPTPKQRRKTNKKKGGYMLKTRNRSAIMNHQNI